MYCLALLLRLLLLLPTSYFLLSRIACCSGGVVHFTFSQLSRLNFRPISRQQVKVNIVHVDQNA